MVAIGQRAGFFIDVFRLALAHFVDARVYVFAADCWFRVGDGHAGVFTELEAWSDFKLRLEL
ncbi:hypothetical protein D3C83_314010 [compost metagenome]